MCDGSVQFLNQYMSPQVLVLLVIGARDGRDDDLQRRPVISRAQRRMVVACS